MVKIIHIMGKEKSGKTSSIRLFLENHCGLLLPKKPMDVQEIVTIEKDGKFYKGGVATGGDTDKIIIDNFIFFTNKEANGSLDFIVCPSRTRGKSFNELKNQVSLLIPAAKIDITVRTKQVDKDNITLKDKDNKRVSDEIWNHIP